MFFSIDMPTRLPNLCVSCHTTIEQPSHTIEQLWHNSVTTATLLNSPPSDPHLWWQACPWRKSLSRKIALTRIKFYGRKLQVKAFPAFGQMQGCADFMRLGAILCPGNFHPWYSITIYSLAKSGLYEMKQHIQSTENIHWTKLGTCETWIVNYWIACTMFIRIVIIQRMLAENKRTVTSGEVSSDGIAVLTVGSPYGGNRWIVTSQCSYVKGG